MNKAIMKQYASAFDDGKMAGAGDGVNGIALPAGDILLGTSNDSATAVQSAVSIYDLIGQKLTRKMIVLFINCLHLADILFGFADFFGSNTDELKNRQTDRQKLELPHILTVNVVTINTMLYKLRTLSYFRPTTTTPCHSRPLRLTTNRKETTPPTPCRPAKSCRLFLRMSLGTH